MRESTATDLAGLTPLASPSSTNMSSRTRSTPPSARTSPYPQRLRTPPQAISLAPSPIGGGGSARPHSLSPLARGSPQQLQQGIRNQYQVYVRPLVKLFINQREASGDVLPDFVASGSSFDDIMQVLWEQFGDKVKCRAVRDGGEWEMHPKSRDDWHYFFQFKTTTHIPRPDNDWHRWLVRHRNEQVRLLIYVYGIGVATAKQRTTFEAKHMTPTRTDRAGAAAEPILQDMVRRLQSRWSTVFRAHDAVWRMWANHILRDLNPSTWDAQVDETQPHYIAELLRLADSTADRRVSEMRRSALMSLDCVNASLADLKDLREEVERRIQVYERGLEGRKRIIEPIIRDTVLPSGADAIDQVPLVENIADVEHQD